MQLVDTREAAQVLKLKPATLAQWRWMGKGPRFRKIGNAVRYAVRDLEDYVEQQARTSTSDPGPKMAADRAGIPAVGKRARIYGNRSVGQ